MEKINQFWEELKNSVAKLLPNLLGAVIIAAVGIVLALVIVHIARKAMERKKVDPSLSSFICHAIRITIYIFTLFAALSALNISIAGLIAFFSAAVAAVALALKDRLSDIASGIVILFSKPFVTGDFIEFDNHSGFVQKIGLMHTDILTYSGTNVIIPNSVISGAEVNNHTAEPIVRVQVDVPIPYDADINKVKEVLFKVIGSTELLKEDESHKPSVQLQSFGESSLDFNVRVFCDFKDYWKVYYSLTERIKEALDENRITIPFNQLDVHIQK